MSDMHIFGVDLPTVSKAVGGNARGHWRTRHRNFQDAKNIAQVTIRNALNEHGFYGDIHMSPVKVEVIWFYSNASHRPDRDNMSSRIKPYIDGAVAAGLIPGDGPEHVVGIQYGYERAKKPGVRLVFHHEPKWRATQ